MTVRNWKFHGSRLVLAFILLLVVGWLFGHPVIFAAIGFTSYACWHLINVWRLRRWLQNQQEDIPESRGIWFEIFEMLRSLDQQKRRQEAQYKNTISEFQGLTNALPDATLVIDAQHNITWCNDSSKSLLGLKIPEDLGQSITNLLRDPDFSEWLSSDELTPNEVEIPSPIHENRWLQVSGLGFQQEQWLIVLRDITDIRNLEQIRRDFVANISHELRTPVTVMTGYLELLQNDANGEVSTLAERMNKQALQMKTLLDDLLELSLLQSDEIQGEEEEIDIPAMLVQLKEQVQEIGKQKHDLQFNVNQELHLSGNPTDIESAFRNLIVNAMHYTPESGSITVTWQNSKDGPLFSVKDTGIGIPKRDLPRLTERFYRVGSDRARQSGGTGLGLAIVKHVMNAHKARLVIHSELGEGSEFSCIFPPERGLLPKYQN